MALYKKYLYAPLGKFIPVHFDKQIPSGTFIYTLNLLINFAPDPSAFDDCYSY